MKERQARRLAAILAADIVGYSRLIEIDEMATLERQRQIVDEVIYPAVADHQGRIVKTTGDGFLAEFSSAVNATECAVAIQSDLAAQGTKADTETLIRYRMGINLGDVVIDRDDIFGEGVNIASRLENVADPGGLWISASVFEQIKNKLPNAFEPLGPQQFKNISSPIEVYRLMLALPRQTNASEVIAPAHKRWPYKKAAFFLGAIVVLCVAVLIVWREQRDPEPSASVVQMAHPLPDQPSIAVLPFSNLSDDVEQGYLADGITDDLIADLSAMPGLFVIARGTMFSYKGKQVPLVRVAKDLGVRYVLEGSVRRVADTLRINWYLVDAASGGQVWAKRLDGKFSEILRLQEEATGELFVALDVVSDTQQLEAARHPPTVEPEAYDLFLKGMEHYRLDTPEQYKRALEFFKQALAVDASYDRARAAMASVYWRAYIGDWAAVLHLESTAARRMAQKLLEEVESEEVALAQQVRSQILLWRGKHTEAITAAERAITMPESDADAWLILTEALIYGGKSAEALEIIHDEMRRDPNNPSRYTFVEGLARFVQEDFSAAAAAFERSLALNPDLWNPEGKLGQPYCYPCVALISTYGHLGRAEDAKPLLEKATYHVPGFSISSELFLWPFRQGEDIERFRTGLVNAGVPE